MKTLFKHILVLAVMLGTFTSYANATLEVLPSFNSVKKGNSISVTDASGNIVFSGLINFNGNIRQLYDFTQLKDGIYMIEINKDFEIEINTVEVKNNTVHFLNTENEKIFKPVFRIQNDKLIISKIALNNPKMDIELYYNNELIYSETVNGKEVLNRVYKLDHAIKGEYTAVVKSNARVFTKNFKL
ncbi:hypothetical protein KO504_10300 [Winogradskyella psychrotolerans]|uniref:hypothetical protein n=1 Tax=Winogradskyella psychrotolerans TaxID=1344585 RepID=UPI001C07E311|nr:hypothetical protein [Winogradskyella psychrotolerans]MBU2921733.1 hypothetical protein [Winogradskyella psychrotolerans]